jgi:hypothetical protein
MEGPTMLIVARFESDILKYQNFQFNIRKKINFEYAIVAFIFFVYALGLNVTFKLIQHNCCINVLLHNFAFGNHQILL